MAGSVGSFIRRSAQCMDRASPTRSTLSNQLVLKGEGYFHHHHRWRVSYRAIDEKGSQDDEPQECRAGGADHLKRRKKKRRRKRPKFSNLFMRHMDAVIYISGHYPISASIIVLRARQIFTLRLCYCHIARYAAQYGNHAGCL